MSKYGKRAVGLLLTGALCAGLLAGCGGAPEAAGTPTAPLESGSASGRRVETLRLEGGTDWGVPNPYLHQSRGPGTAKMRLVYGSLLEKDETGDVPWLAERWSMDVNDYTFIRFADAQFQDGAPLTTADVAFTLDYYQEHPFIEFDTVYGDAKYEVFGAFTIDVVNDTSFIYNQYIDMDEDTYNRYVDQVISRSDVDSGIRPSYGEQLLTLSTCEYSSANGRYVVVARRVSD